MKCLNGICTGPPKANLYNVLIYEMGNFEPVSTSVKDVLTFENVTVHYCTNLASASVGVGHYTNCLFVCMTNWAYYTLFTNSCAVLNSDSGLFQTVGAGSHYLADGSPYREAGTTNIDRTLLSDLRKKTTFPPLVYSNATIAVDTTFIPQAQRDTDAQPSLGWHYDPLDYVFGGCTANGNLTFQQGTAVAWFRTTSGWQHAGQGIHIGDSLAVNFNGTATAPTWWVRYNAVQEQANSNWSGGYGPGGITGWAASLSVAPTVNANFLHCAILGGEGGSGNHFRDDWGYLLVRSWSSEYGGGSLGGYTTSQYNTNCLFERTSVWLDQGQVDNVWWLRNCTLHGGQLYISRSANPTPVSVRDTTFDNAGFPVVDQYASNTNYTDYDYNAFIYGDPRTSPTGPHDVIVTNSFNWETSWFGNYYLPTNSPLLNMGDVLAGTNGLYHFTCITNSLTYEDSSQVTIGYHYVATDDNGNPLDSNGDGIPDYVSDPNGNGLVDSGEIDWANAGDLGLKVFITEPKRNANIP